MRARSSQYIQTSVVCLAGVGCLAVRARAHSPPGRARQGTHAARAVKIMVQSSKASAVQKRYGLAARRANTLHAAVTGFSPSDSFQTAPFGLPKNVAVCEHLSRLFIKPKHRHGTLAILSVGRDSRPFSLPFLCPQ